MFKRFLKNHKGVFQNLQALGIAIAGLCITLTVTFLILAQGQDQVVSLEGITNESNTSQWTIAYNATNTMTNAVADIPGWVPLIVIAVIGSVLLGLVALFRR